MRIRAPKSPSGLRSTQAANKTSESTSPGTLSRFISQCGTSIDTCEPSFQKSMGRSSCTSLQRELLRIVCVPDDAPEKGGGRCSLWFFPRIPIPIPDVPSLSVRLPTLQRWMRLVKCRYYVQRLIRFYLAHAVVPDNGALQPLRLTGSAYR